MQAVPQCFVPLGDIVGKEQSINNAKEQLLGFRCARGQQGAPVLHYAPCTIPKTATLIHLEFLFYNVAKDAESGSPTNSPVHQLQPLLVLAH